MHHHRPHKSGRLAISRQIKSIYSDELSRATPPRRSTSGSCTPPVGACHRTTLNPLGGFRLAAEQGDASAQSALGFKYDIGEGVPQDYAEAVRWYRLAAEQGDASAQRGLGFNYATDQGVPQDDVSAHMWLNLAAAAGGAGAREAREMVAQNMTREQIAEAQARAREWINANR